ncbi:MAG: iron-containing redox enzyme family protein, partial [Jatrophihabitantaceae bacterium]
MPVTADGTFELPDTVAALPVRPFEFSAAAERQADEWARASGPAMFGRLLRDQESEAALLLARRILHAFQAGTAGTAGTAGETLPAEPAAAADRLLDQLAGVRAELAEQLAELSLLPAEVHRRVLAQRAPLALLDGCWLDLLSQPATQPSIIVNRLFAQYCALRGAGNPLRDQDKLRRQALAAAGLDLPEIGAHDFLARAGARPLTALHACYYLALSRLPANFLPEVVGVHHAFRLLGVDDQLLGTEPIIEQSELAASLVEYLQLAGTAERARLAGAIGLVIELEREQVGLLVELGRWRAGLSLEARVAEIVARHAPLAGSQHGQVRLGGQLLADWFSDPNLDLVDFLEQLRESGFVRAGSSGLSPLIRAMKFGGPMFGIFDADEAELLGRWVASVQRGERPPIELSAETAGDQRAASWQLAIAGARPADVVIAEARPGDHRELFHRLVNIENFANTLPLAAEQVRANLAAAEILFSHGAGGRYTDASYFDYSAEALYQRGEQVYWDKLVNPYRPLTELPDRDEVIFTQSTYALGYLIDGAWLHRLGNLGHRERTSDRMLASIYADEMGYGDLAKNHITLTHRVLASLGIRLPHIRDERFRDQDDLPDDLYGFSLHQLSLCLLPDTFYNELLGYNFAIEMFGSGELRL